MNEGFGYYDTEDGEQPESQDQQQRPPKWYRDKLEADSKAMKEMREELDRLRQESRQAKVAQQFAAKGFNPAAAALYGGEPDKADEWLSTYGALLAQRPEGDAQQGSEQIPAGPPASSVPPEVQEQMQRMQTAGVGPAARPQGSEAELAAAIKAANSPEELAKIMRANGSQFF